MITDISAQSGAIFSTFSPEIKRSELNFNRACVKIPNFNISHISQMIIDILLN